MRAGFGVFVVGNTGVLRYGLLPGCSVVVVNQWAKAARSTFRRDWRIQSQSCMWPCARVASCVVVTSVLGLLEELAQPRVRGVVLRAPSPLSQRAAMHDQSQTIVYVPGMTQVLI